MLVKDGSPMRHIGLQWVSDETCRSIMGLRLGMSVSDGSQIAGMLVSDEARWSPMGLQSGMLVSDQACRSRMGLRLGMSVSDRSSMGLG